MAQEMKHPADRDCLIAATLAAGGSPTSPELLVERFKVVLQTIVQAGGTYQMWSDANDPEGKGPTMMIG